MLKAGNEMLRDDVSAELADDPRVDAARIGVAVDDGVVTLTGNGNPQLLQCCIEPKTCNGNATQSD